MPQADTEHTPSRRTFLGHLAGAAAATGIVYGCTDLSAATPAGPDVELLRLGAALTEARVREAAAWAASAGAFDDNGPRAREADAASQHSSSIVDQIEHTPASTLEGLLVKMQAVAWCLTDDPLTVGDISDHPTTDMRLVASLLNDLSRINGRA